MNLTLMSLGLIPQPKKPKLPKGASRIYVDTGHGPRPAKRYLSLEARRDAIVKFMREQGSATVSELCDHFQMDVGLIGVDIRLLKKAGRVYISGATTLPKGGKQNVWSAHAEET